MIQQTIRELLGRQLLFFDGAMGTQLQEAGLKPGDIPELWNVTRPETVQGIHKKYLAVGSDIIITNTFGCNALKLNGTGFSVGQIAAQAVENAQTATTDYTAVKQRFIALDIGPTGRLLKPFGDLDFEQAIALFSETVIAGAKAGADLIIIETMSDAYELKSAVLAAKENSNLPVIASVTLDKNGKMLTGGGTDVVIALLEGLGVDAIGFNCGLGPEQLAPYITHALEICSIPILLMPNAGLPTYADGATKYDVDPQMFASSMRRNAEKGIWLLGGCCGTTPAHIEALVKECTGLVPPAITKKNITSATSYSKTVAFGSKPIIIGERINPTGKSQLKKALLNEDYDFAVQEGIEQIEQGATALDVNVGMPGIDETATLKTLVEQLQEVTSAPLQIDTAAPGAMAHAMRIYNGKPIINSVNGKTESMDAIFPLVKHYGGVIVALTLDEKGIPETAQGRIDIAKKILDHAKQHGIGKEAFLFDPLTMAVSAGQDSARVTLESVRRLKNELGVKTSLGVSNVSFGLPCRDVLNATFLSLALEAGLDAAILNPGISAMHQAIEAHANGKPSPDNEATDALLGKDVQFKRYIEIHGKQQPEETTTEKTDMTLGEAVLKGLKQEAANCAERSLELYEPLEVIERELIPALNAAGQRFEHGTMYLPQLLICAEAAKSAFTVIRTAIASNESADGKFADGDSNDGSIGTVVVATVEGDIHDIGKNIVRAMLENYRFRVVDLGKDVPAQKVVDAVQKHKARLAGLSALMTTTVVSMEKTIKALHEVAPDCKIMCGGAVLTKEYATRIGADFYAKDAMASVRYAQQVIDTR